MSTEVEPRFQTNRDVCGCGCGKFGRLKKPWRSNGVRCVANTCRCRQCVGGRQVPNARRRENKVATAAGGTREPMSGNLSGFDFRSGLWVGEETAQESLVRGFRRWITSKGVTTKLARLMAQRGVRRVFVVSWDGRAQWAVIPFEDWANQAADDVQADAVSRHTRQADTASGAER